MMVREYNPSENKLRQRGYLQRQNSALYMDDSEFPRGYIYAEIQVFQEHEHRCQEFRVAAFELPKNLPQKHNMALSYQATFTLT